MIGAGHDRDVPGRTCHHPRSLSSPRRPRNAVSGDDGDAPEAMAIALTGTLLTRRPPSSRRSGLLAGERRAGGDEVAGGRRVCLSQASVHSASLLGAHPRVVSGRAPRRP
jgi:hypothetical protein